MDLARRIKDAFLEPEAIGQTERQAVLPQSGEKECQGHSLPFLQAKKCLMFQKFLLEFHAFSSKY